MGFHKEDLIISRIWPSAANKWALKVLGSNKLEAGGTQFVKELSCSGKPRRVGSTHSRQEFYQER